MKPATNHNHTHTIDTISCFADRIVTKPKLAPRVVRRTHRDKYLLRGGHTVPNYHE
jgi:hypothetical protein